VTPKGWRSVWHGRTGVKAPATGRRHPGAWESPRRPHSAHLAHSEREPRGGRARWRRRAIPRRPGQACSTRDRKTRSTTEGGTLFFTVPRPGCSWPSATAAGGGSWLPSGAPRRGVGNCRRRGRPAAPVTAMSRRLGARYTSVSVGRTRGAGRRYSTARPQAASREFHRGTTPTPRWTCRRRHARLRWSRGGEPSDGGRGRVASRERVGGPVPLSAPGPGSRYSPGPGRRGCGVRRVPRGSR
jgi:hypothetical protein